MESMSLLLRCSTQRALMPLVWEGSQRGWDRFLPRYSTGNSPLILYLQRLLKSNKGSRSRKLRLFLISPMALQIRNESLPLLLLLQWWTLRHSRSKKFLKKPLEAASTWWLLSLMSQAKSSHHPTVGFGASNTIYPHLMCIKSTHMPKKLKKKVFLTKSQNVNSS